MSARTGTTTGTTTAQSQPSAAGTVIAGFAELAPTIDMLICDVWGVVHDGQTAHRAACSALERFRAGGGCVVMVSNAPRPGADVVVQLERFGVTHSAFDRIVTSGDLTRGLMAGRPGQPLLHLGPPRDHSLFEGLDVRFAGPADADYCVCTGFDDDETQTPADYADTLRLLASRAIPMICANPDLVVERGHKLIPCAGAMALAYERLGGVVTYAGKPHQPVYRRALELAAEVLGAEPPLDRVAAVGDAIRTDVAGAAGLGVRSLLLLDGIHWHDAGRDDWQALHGDWLGAQAVKPTWVMPRLAW
jgi:HAD superfamily hydrolase (TIGR01459 family)